MTPTLNVLVLALALTGGWTVTAAAQDGQPWKPKPQGAAAVSPNPPPAAVAAPRAQPPPKRPLAAARPPGPQEPSLAPPLGAVARGLSEGGPSQEVARAMAQMHLTVCAGAVQKAADFLIEGQAARFIAQPLGPDSDRWPTVFVIESADPAGGHTRLSTLMMAPNCSGMYEQIVVWRQPCATVKAVVFANYAAEHPLLRDVYVSEASPALQVFLTAAGTGCLSVKKELFH